MSKNVEVILTGFIRLSPDLSTNVTNSLVEFLAVLMGLTLGMVLPTGRNHTSLTLVVLQLILYIIVSYIFLLFYNWADKTVT